MHDLIKILYLTDTHITGKTPSGRNDNITDAIFKKLIEVGNIIKQENIDVVIHGGDVFNTPRVSIKLAGIVAQIIKSWNIPVYITPGNHDLFGYSITTIEQTMLGLLFQTGVVKLLIKGNPEIFKYDNDMREVIIEGQEYHKDIDNDINDDYSLTPYTPKQNYKTTKILVPHGMLIDNPFHPDVPCTLTKDVAHTTDADVILCSHYHSGVKTQKINNTWFYGPGSLVRMENTKEERKRTVKVGIITINNNGDINIKDTPLKTAACGTDIFSKSQKKKSQIYESQLMMETFQTQLEQGIKAAGRSTNVFTMLNQLTSSQSTLDQNIIDEVTVMLQNVMNHYSSNDLNALGYLESPTRKIISKVELENFQSHSHSVIDFIDGLNVVVGETNSGKTSLFRAMRWCMYDLPRGSDFIRTGSNSCRVRITYDDGSAIERRRTRSSAGEYEVWDANGKSNIYKGFANNIPVEIINTHQMPEINFTDTFSANLNFSTQLEGPFLLSASGFEKASAIGKLTGTDIVDLSIKESARILAKCNKDVKQKTIDIEEYEKRLKDYDYLNDYNNNLKLYEYVIDETQMLEEKIKQSQILLNEYKSLVSEISDVKAYLKTLPNWDDKLHLISEAKSIVELMRQAEMLSYEYLRISQMLYKGKMVYSSYPNETQISNYLLEINRRIHDINIALDLQNEINNVSHEKKNLIDYSNYNENMIDDILKKVHNIIKDIKIAHQLSVDLINVSTNIDLEKANMTNYNLKLQESTATFQQIIQEKFDYIKKTGVCPLCGSNHLNEEHVRNIAKGGL